MEHDLSGGSLKYTKSILRALVISAPYGMTISHLEKDYKKTVGAPIPFKKLGYYSIEKFLDSISDVLNVRYGPNPMVFATSSERTQHIEKLVSAQKNISRFKKSTLNHDYNATRPIVYNQWTSHTVVTRVRNEFDSDPNSKNNFNTTNSPQSVHGNGAYFKTRYFIKDFKNETKLPYHHNEIKNRNQQLTTYKSNEVFKKPFPSNPSRAILPKPETVISLNSNNKETVNEKSAQKEDLRAILPNETTKISQTDNNKDKETAIEKLPQQKIVRVMTALPILDRNDVVFRIDFPKNCVVYGHKILQYEFPHNLEVGSILKVFVTEVHNPYKFWFHIAKENHELDDLMQNLDNFYSNLSVKELQMTAVNMNPGQICVALYSHLWHRAEILQPPINNKVKVCFFDYGTVSEIPIDLIKYLKIEFSKLTRQALRGCLSNIRPVGHRWSRDATFTFLSMVADLPLYAKITNILKCDKIMTFLLTDTTQENDLQINKALVFRNHAKLTYEDIQDHHQFLYPSFGMLENGQFPTFGEIGKQLARGIDFEAKHYNSLLPYIYAEKCSLEEYIQKLTSFHIIRTQESIEYNENIPNKNPFY